MNKKLTKLFAASAVALTLGAVVAPAASAAEAVKRVDPTTGYMTPNGVPYAKLTPAEAQTLLVRLLGEYQTEEAKQPGLEQAVYTAEDNLKTAKENYSNAEAALAGAKKLVEETKKAEEEAHKEWAAAKKALEEAQGKYTADAAAIKKAAAEERAAAEKARDARIQAAVAKVAEAQAAYDVAARAAADAVAAHNAYATPEGQDGEADDTELGLLAKVNETTAAAGAAMEALDAAKAEAAAEETNAHAEFNTTVENVNARERKALGDINYDFKDKTGYKVQPEEEKLLAAEKAAATKAAEATKAREEAEKEVPKAAKALADAKTQLGIKHSELLRAQKELSNQYAKTTGLLADIVEISAQQGLNVANSGVALTKDQLEAIKDAKAKGTEAVLKDKKHFEDQAKGFEKAADDVVKETQSKDGSKADESKDGKKEDKKDVAKADKKAEAKPAAKPAAKAAAKSEGKELPKTGEETAMVVIGAGLVATIAGGALVVSNRKKA